MSQIVAKLLLGGALAVLLPSCYGTELTIDRHAGAVTLAFNFSQPLKLRDVAAEPTPVTAVASTDKGSVVVRGFHEPGDFAHRNYCGAGATQVLLSGWMRSVPDIETVAARSHLNPSRGEYGADALDRDAAVHGAGALRPAQRDLVANARRSVPGEVRHQRYGQAVERSRRLAGQEDDQASHLLGADAGAQLRQSPLE